MMHPNHPTIPVAGKLYRLLDEDSPFMPYRFCPSLGHWVRNHQVREVVVPSMEVVLCLAIKTTDHFETIVFLSDQGIFATNHDYVSKWFQEVKAEDFGDP